MRTRKVVIQEHNIESCTHVIPVMNDADTKDMHYQLVTIQSHANNVFNISP